LDLWRCFSVWTLLFLKGRRCTAPGSATYTEWSAKDRPAFDPAAHLLYIAGFLLPLGTVPFSLIHLLDILGNS
jgi:hypothetical protein